MAKESIIEVESSQGWKNFLALGQEIRTKQSALSASFWKDTQTNSHLGYAKFWLLNGKGRVGAYYFPGNPHGYIGWYEVVNEDHVADALLTVATKWLHLQGCTQVMGPINGSSWYPYRFNLKHASPLFPGEPFQPAYYLKQWVNFGFEPSIFYHSSRVDIRDADYSEKDFGEFLSARELRKIDLDEKSYKIYKNKIRDLLNDCFPVNPLFKPINGDEFRLIYDKIATSLPKGMSFLLCKAQDDILVGLYVSYPDLVSSFYDTKGKQDPFITTPKLIVKTAATHPSWQNQQISTYAVRYLHALARKKGFVMALHAMMFHHNVSFKASKKKFDSSSCRTYALMKKEL